MDTLKMPSPQNVIDASNNPVGETTHLMAADTDEERIELQTSATKGNSDSLEPNTGDFIMESRIPEESATTSYDKSATTSYDTGPSASTEDSSMHQQQAKRQRVSAGCTVSREEINEKAQQLIDDINNKRKADTMLLTDFKKSMEMQVARSYGLLEQSMFQIYEHNGKIMQAKLQELFATLDRIAKLEAELQEFKNALGALYTDIQQPL